MYLMTPINLLIFKILCVAFTVSKYRVFSGPYFPVFSREKTPYLEIFHAVLTEGYI